MLWIVALWFVFCGWDTGCLLLIAFSAGRSVEFYIAPRRKRAQGFKQSGLFCGALIFFNSWYFLDSHAATRISSILRGTRSRFLLLGAFIRLVVVPEAHRDPITTAALTLLGCFTCRFFSTSWRCSLSAGERGDRIVL